MAAVMEAALTGISGMLIVFLLSVVWLSSIRGIRSRGGRHGFGSRLGLLGLFAFRFLLLGFDKMQKRLNKTNAPTGRVDRNWTESGGNAPYNGFLSVGELAQVSHYPETRTSPGGYLHRTGSGQVDMLTCSIAAARAAVATGMSGSIDTRHVSDSWK